MHILERFQAYAEDFEKTYVDDDWSRIRPYFSEDAIYEVRGMPASQLSGKGRQGVVDTLKQSIDDFDRRCASRKLELTAPPQVDGQAVIIQWRGVYTVDGGEDLVIAGQEVATYNGAGEIESLIDTYDEEAARGFEAWMAAHQELLA